MNWMVGTPKCHAQLGPGMYQPVAAPTTYSLRPYKASRVQHGPEAQHSQPGKKRLRFMERARGLNDADFLNVIGGFAFTHCFFLALRSLSQNGFTSYLLSPIKIGGWCCDSLRVPTQRIAARKPLESNNILQGTNPQR